MSETAETGIMSPMTTMDRQAARDLKATGADPRLAAGSSLLDACPRRPA